MVDIGKKFLEKHIEKYFTSEMKRIGGKGIKMIPTYDNGIPDRQALYKGRTVFIEFKKEGEKPRPLQINFMKELGKMGFEVCVIDSIQGVNELIKRLINEEPI